MKIRKMAIARDSGKCPVGKGVAGHLGTKKCLTDGPCGEQIAANLERVETFIESRVSLGLPVTALGYEVAAAKAKAEKAASRKGKTTKPAGSKKTSGTRKSATAVSKVQTSGAVESDDEVQALQARLAEIFAAREAAAEAVENL